jgi:hypothetical protein
MSVTKQAEPSRLFFTSFNVSFLLSTNFNVSF